MAFPKINLQEASWSEVVRWIEYRMSKNRHEKGKFCPENEDLWRLKKAMQEVDPSIQNVGATFHEHENADFDVKY